MTFLNPLLLFGLAAAAIPVILHLLNLRKLKTIDFSTLKFLKELQQTKIRRLKIRQILLLIVRTLLVTLIVLAFARPALRGRILGTIGSHAHSSVILIIDDSFSLSVSDEHGDRLKQLKDAAFKCIDLLKDGDEVFLIKLSDLPKATVEPAMHDFSAIRTIVQETEISSIRRPLDDALRVSARLLAQSNNANKEIYIISDMQQTLLPQQRTAAEQSNHLFDERVKFFVVPVGSKIIANASVDSVDVRSKILEKNKPAKVFASIRNFSDVPLRDYIVSVFLDGNRTAQTNVSADPFGSATVEFTITPKRSGDISGYIELENDAIELDNRRYFLLKIPDHVNVAILAGHQTGSDYLSTALRSAAAQGEESLLHIEQLPEEKFPFLDLKKTDVVICSNVKSLFRSDIDRLREFVLHGGGLVIFPGDHVDRQAYNSQLLPALEIPSVDSITRTLPGQAPVSFKSVDLDHPLFETMFERETRGKKMSGTEIESPMITTSLPRVTGKRGRTLISLTNGYAFLSEYSLGEGEILFYSVAPTASWSDFPFKGIFAPLVYRSVIYAAAGGNRNETYITGVAPTITLPHYRSGAGQSTLVSPDGVEDLLQAAPAANTGGEYTRGTSFAIKAFRIPGIYELKNAKTHVASIVVNADKLESDTRPVSRDELSLFWKRMGVPESSIESLDQGDQIQNAVLQSRFGVELWKYCIALALLLALVEMLIARDSRNAAEVKAA